ncbi:SDR family oxidoreductase [Humitalea sp. 24SJ18S-53]|uniref:SDR family oxidoreductase n=1 Tax=Humitalea sp. 24SJ18S-53 TaxID=3422307 RepID=UPI003D67087E
MMFLGVWVLQTIVCLINLCQQQPWQDIGMDLGIAGRSALICGGSKGMGRAAALEFAKAGCLVTIAARNPDTLAEAAEAMRAETGARVDWVSADITTPEGRAKALAACPAPDILLNNTEGPRPGNFRDWTPEDWMVVLNAVMISPIEMIRATVDGMMARRWGRIVNITSRSVKNPQPELGLSNGARSGLTGFVAGLARQTISHNVTINNVLPGAVDTEAQRNHMRGMVEASGQSFDALRRERESRTPAGRFGRPEEIGATCAFVCSDLAGFMTGQNILVDGGDYKGTF